MKNNDRCPYCGEIMVKGLIQSARQAFFTKKYRWLTLSDEDVRLTDFWKGTADAWHCPNCKKIIVEYK